MNALLGSSLGVYVGLTLGVAGFAAWMTGLAMATTWKPAWHCVVYGLPLGAADRFLVYALFDGPLLSASGYATHAATLVVIALVAFRYHRVRAVVRQYPWEWRRRGPFTLERIGGGRG